MFLSCCNTSTTEAAEADAPKWEAGPAVSEEELKKDWPEKPETFEVEVAHKSGKLGLDIGHYQGKYLKIQAVKEGSVSKHNKANTDKALNADHYIMAVNGVEGDSKKMLDEATNTSTPRGGKLKFLVSRGVPVADPWLCRIKCEYDGAVPGATFYLTYGNNVATHTLEENWDSQKWWMHDAGDGFFRIQNKLNGKWMNYDWDQEKPVLIGTEYWDSPSMKWTQVAFSTDLAGCRLQNADKHPFENEQNGYGQDGKSVDYRYWYLNEGNTGDGTDNRTVGLISNYKLTDPPQWTWTSAQWTFPTTD